MTVLDLFCGAGGLSEGFRQAGYRIVAGADSDPDACATFARNFRKAETIHGDLRKRSVFAKVLAAADQVDIVVGGPPCQAFSQVRNHARLIDDPRNSLYREFVRALRRIRPRAFVMENVPGLQQMGIREQVSMDLSLRGAYTVESYDLDAADFGVPQTRKRIVFVGIDRSLGVDPPVIPGTNATAHVRLSRRNGNGRPRYSISGGSELGHALGNRLRDAGDASIVTVEQAIGDLTGLRAATRADQLDVSTLPAPATAYQRSMRRGCTGVLTNTSVPRINEDTVLRLSAIPPGGNYRDLSDELLQRHLTGQLWGPTNGSGRLGRRHYYAYRRLHRGIWSWTLNTKADSVYHYKAARALSVREFARLQSFPDKFVFTTDSRKGELPGRISGGAAHSRYRQVGNAVPPLLARAIARALHKAVSGSGARGTAST